MTVFTWDSLDDKAVAMARALAADAVQKVGNGHPGTAMSLAPCAYLIFQKHLRHDPADPQWAGRDRFVLSVGHSSLTLYLQLFLSGYPMSLDDLKSFRTANSQTPAHPEFGHTPGVETTTGPLGQGIANAVGLAMAAKYQKAQINSSNFSDLLDPTIYCLAGDGCVQEGVSAEASSLAGHLKLDNLILIYDDNKISIDGATDLSFTEDVSERYRSYGWNVIEVPKKNDGDIDISALDTALVNAKKRNGKPTLIKMQSTIAWPAPKLQNTAKSHGSALGKEEVAATKVVLGLNPDLDFQIDDLALAKARDVANRGAALHAEWNTRFNNWQKSEEDAFSRFLELQSKLNLDNVEKSLPKWELGKKVATRIASGNVLNALVPNTLQLLGGSADLSGSNGTLIENSKSFGSQNFSGRNIHFGIREHAMGAILNGFALAGLRPYGGTFLVFSDYMRGAVRLSALMNLPVTYIWTHDSIGLGEDGPTHQPIEHLSSLRLMPNFAVVRPADANETAAAWYEILRRECPAGLALSRQDLPVVVEAKDALDGVAKGGYKVKSSKNPKATIIATGSEVSMAVDASEVLLEMGIEVNVVSMPCTSWFDEQSANYQKEVLPDGLPVVAVEAGATALWYKYVGKNGRVIGIDRFGASSAPDVLAQELGLTVDAIVAAVKELV
jgi:transketolase